MPKSMTVTFNILYIVLIVAGTIGFGSFQPSQTVIEIGAIVGAIANLYLRLRPLPKDQEGFR